MKNHIVIFIFTLLITTSGITQADEKAPNFMVRLEETPASVMDVGRLRLDLYLGQAIQDIRNSWSVKNVELFEARSFNHENERLYLIARGKAAARFLNIKECAAAIGIFDKELNAQEKLSLTWEGMISKQDIEKLAEYTYLMVIVEETTNPSLQFRCISKLGSGEATEHK